MEKNDIVIVRYTDPQPLEVWRDILTDINRHLPVKTFLHTRVDLSEDRRSLRVYLKDGK